MTVCPSRPLRFVSTSLLSAPGGLAVALLRRAPRAVTSTACAAATADYVIQISVDGMGSSYLQALIDEGQLPTFKRLQTEGAWTNNARTDFDYTITLPNHTCMVTGRPVKDKPAVPTAIAGHNWVINTDPGDKTIHNNRHDYVTSTFDVAHDHGLRTAMFASKSKFVLYDQSYDVRNGAPDTTGDDNGRDKIDLYVKRWQLGRHDRSVHRRDESQSVQLQLRPLPRRRHGRSRQNLGQPRVQRGARSSRRLSGAGSSSW